ncbi:MAG: cytochrome c [Hyphomicrobiaceae bacterium]|nr:MAG: cytochrome c [Hyphomicrobiaceae bacterium]
MLATGAALAGAQELGDVRQGLAYARKVCAECHAVVPSQLASPNPDAPSFASVANTPGMTATALHVWLHTSHPTMPNLILEPDTVDDVVAYILSLRRKR